MVEARCVKSSHFGTGRAQEVGKGAAAEALSCLPVQAEAGPRE